MKRSFQFNDLHIVCNNPQFNDGTVEITVCGQGICLTNEELALINSTIKNLIKIYGA